VSDPGPSRKLSTLLFFALDHGVDSVRSGGPLIPFLLTESQGERKLERFVANRLEDALDNAVRRANDLPIGAERWAIAYDGYLTVGGTRHDAIYVEGVERGAGRSFVLAQRYVPKTRFRSLKAVGNPALLPSPHRLVPD
jgi:hypothetical protein